MANEPRLAFKSIAGKRPYQEDAVLAETLEDGRVLVAVADGMGGHAAGEVASALALETLVEAVKDGQSLAEAFTLANSRVYEKAREPGKQGMGTTLVAALIADGDVTWANVGDSRGYVITDGGIERLTQDHSFVAEAVKRGQSEAEAMSGPWKDALTRSIGTEKDVEVDTFGPMPVSTDCALVVCSDGLYKTLTDDDLLRIYSMSLNPLGAAQSLVSTALDKGSDDNISVAVAEYGEVDREDVGGTMPLDYRFDDDRPAESGEPAETAAPEPVGAGAASERSARATASAPPIEAAIEASADDPTSMVPVAAAVTAVIVIGALLLLFAF